MASERDDLRAREKKEHKLEIRDLKPKADVKGGARNGGNGEKRPTKKIGEIDFMNWD